MLKQMSLITAATRVVERLQEAGHIAYFAGGWVRDHLMDHPSDDIDIATSASTEEVEALFKKTVPVGVAFGIIIVLEGGHQFEVATFRKDRGYMDGRRPSGIDPATPEEDAERRDFTINGLFYDPLSETLYDFVGGTEDIKRGAIRAIGDPSARFAEDRLRMMRAVRYSTRFNFPIEEETEAAIRAHASELLPAVAMERVWQEFKKMSRFAHFDTGLIMLHDLGLLATIFPDLKGVTLTEIARRVQHIESFPKGAPTFGELLELFPDYALEEIVDLSEYLKLSNKEKDFSTFYHHARALFNLPEPWHLEKIEWAEFYASPHAEICLGMIAAHYPTAERATFLKKHVLQRESLKDPIERLRNQNPYLSASDLIAEGVKPGKAMGELLALAMRIAVNETIHDKSTLLALLKKSTLWKTP
jgi:poly(A) polymerase